MANTRKPKTTQVPTDVLEQTESVVLDLSKTTGCKIDDSVLLRVKSTCFGKLYYRNSKTGDETVWDHAGDIQIMSMGDLRAMRATQVGFFSNQWVVILGVADGSDCDATCADIYKSLIITKYYEDYVEPTDVATVISWSVSEINERVGIMTQGARDNLIVALNECVKTGMLDSMKKIRAFEDALGCQLRSIE